MYKKILIMAILFNFICSYKAYAQQSEVFQSEEQILTDNFEIATNSWNKFYEKALNIEYSSAIFNKDPLSLMVSKRAHNYDGAYIDISQQIMPEQTYVVRGFVKKEGTKKDTYILNAKIGSKTYKQLNRVFIDNNDWTKFRAFVRFSQSEIAQGIKLYINSQSYKDNYYLDNFEIVKSNYTPPVDGGTEILKISENKIIDSNANTIRLKGINLIAYNDAKGVVSDNALETFMNYSYYNYDKEDFINLKNLGFNSIRLALWYRYFEDDKKPGVYLEKGFEWLNFIIGWAKEAGLYVVLDMHAPQGGGFQGPSHITPFWSGKTYQTRFINLWKEIANRYKYESAIGAYDLLNEPCPKNQSQYITLANSTIDAIRGIDSNHIINVETTFAKDNEPFLLQKDNILYDFHFYDPWSKFTASKKSIYSTNVSRSEVEVLFREYADFYKNYPFQVSEFGQKYINFKQKNSSLWVRDVIGLLDEYGASYHYFSFKGNEFGLFEIKNSFSNNCKINEDLKQILTDSLQ